MKSKITKLVAALVVGLGVCAGAMAQGEGQNNSYYEGKTWDQFHGEEHYFKGSPSAICAAAIQAWNKTTEVVAYEPIYTQIIEGIYKGTYEIRPSPPYTFPYIYCSASLKTSYIYPTHPALNRVYLNENFNAGVTITKVVDCDKINMMRSASAEDIEACKKPEPEPEPESCKIEGIDHGNFGGQVCDQNAKIEGTCVWRDTIRAEHPTNEKAVDIIAQCVNLHEKDHMRYTNHQRCNNARRTEWTQYGDQYECDGHIIELKCLIEQLDNLACGDDGNCVAELINRRNTLIERVTNEDAQYRYCARRIENGIVRYGGFEQKYP